MKATKDLHKRFGVAGSYVLMKLQVEAASKKSGRVPIGSKIAQYAKEWNPTHLSTLKLTDEALIRKVVQFGRDNGILTLVQAKSGTFLEFTTDYMPKRENYQIKHSLKARERGADKAKPKDVDEVFAYFRELEVEDAMEEATLFFDYWQEKGWRRKGGLIRDWKATARRWKQASAKRNMSSYL